MWDPSKDIAGLDEAQEIIRANVSPRYKRLAFLESWVEGRQYDGLTSWWDDSVPLWERAPCIVYPVVDVAISSNVDLVLGDGRFPSFTSRPDEDESEDGGLGEDESKGVDTLLRDYHRITQFRSHCREAFRASQSCGTAVAIHGVRNGKPTNELVPARWCEASFDLDGRVEKLEIRYPYIETYRDERRQWRARVKLYRRVIDSTSDTVYLPADADKQGREPSWKVDESRSGNHGLGFCPVVWYAFMQGCSTVAEVDGKAVHRNILDEIRQHDIARSQWHRGALMSEPQMVEIGVPAGFNPTETGRLPFLPSSEAGGEITDSNPRNGGFASTATAKSARKKGPGYTYQYPGIKAEVDVKYLTYPGDALASQKDNAADLLIKLQEALAVVLLDPHNIKFAATTSGKALEAIKQRQVDRCDQYRDDFRDGFLLPSIEMQLRIVRELGDQVLTQGSGEVGKALETITGDDWRGPGITVSWGPYWPPAVEDEKPIVEMAKLAKDGGLITTEKAVERVKGIFAIENVDEFVESLKAETEEREAADLSKQEAQAKIAQQFAPPAQQAPPPGKKKFP